MIDTTLLETQQEIEDQKIKAKRVHKGGLLLVGLFCIVCIPLDLYQLSQYKQELDQVETKSVCSDMHSSLE